MESNAQNNNEMKKMLNLWLDRMWFDPEMRDKIMFIASMENSDITFFVNFMKDYMARWGWHKDSACKRKYRKLQFHFLSLFFYSLEQKKSSQVQ